MPQSQATELSRPSPRPIAHPLASMVSGLGIPIVRIAFRSYRSSELRLPNLENWVERRWPREQIVEGYS
jgi:hypothetical protein